MSQKTNSQSLLNSVRKLDKLNDIDIVLEGNIADIIEDPIKWGEEQAQKALIESQDKYLEAKILGKKLWDEINDKD